VRSRAPLSAVERWDIYANMYFYRLRDCVQQDFAAVAGTIGEVNFHNLMTDYLLAHPPSHFSLRYAGQHLATFLADHELLRDWPYLADLARMEYAIVDAFDAADTQPLDPDALRRVPSEEWPRLQLAVSPAVRLLRLDWPVADVWRAIKDGKEPGVLTAGETHMRVWRRDWCIFHKVIDAHEAAALATLLNGGTFAQMCAAFAEDGQEANIALSMLQTWLAEHVLSASDLSPDALP